MIIQEPEQQTILLKNICVVHSEIFPILLKTKDHSVLELPVASERAIRQFYNIIEKTMLTYFFAFLMHMQLLTLDKR